MKGVDVKKMFVDVNDLCVLYNMITNTSAGTMFIVEWFQVGGQKFSEIRAVFDARLFAAMFAGGHNDQSSLDFRSSRLSC